MITNNNIRIGTLISGTLRDEDLLEAFADELERITHGTGAHRSLISEARTLPEPEFASDIVAELIDALNEYAPIHCYFGALKGDGSDFGFWPTGDDWDNCSGHWVSKHEFIDHDCRVFVQINDHGNITVSELRGEEIWSVV